MIIRKTTVFISPVYCQLTRHTGNFQSKICADSPTLLAVGCFHPLNDILVPSFSTCEVNYNNKNVISILNREGRERETEHIETKTSEAHNRVSKSKNH